ncbi:hypothetical protein BZA05DRAFT_248982 [Tricharina praecox]|uniref:uncharacterized protein n=1 Tax=Tricharina praecox TaxID=43433 RepID=UPI00221E6400|nr:uncharacterized protein BZA05DRAFT_248982 [Tricharina praecox]KAI5854750.1 hypothetical protein BZA05DRAFT_248982 [Tricharina praecox]
MPPPSPLTPVQLQLLRDDSDLLHLLTHRNKNQHRLLKWWQWLSTLRRHLRKLLAEHDAITAAKTTPNRNSALAKFKDRLGFMRKVVVPNAYDAFGSVVGMKNFATLGLVLMGVLARVKEEKEAMARVLALEEENAADELGVVIPREEYAGGDDDGGTIIDRAEYDRLAASREGSDNTGKEYGDRERKKAPSEMKPGDASTKGQSLPIRTQSQAKASELSAPAERVKKTPKENNKTAVKRKSDATEPEKKKKKKKKADDIDDLFSGLF